MADWSGWSEYKVDGTPMSELMSSSHAYFPNADYLGYRKGDSTLSANNNICGAN